jgi:hypothetical protein
LFNDQDNDKAPLVAVVNDAFARAYWPNEDPLGKRIKLDTIQLDGLTAAWRTVVGVVADARTESLEQASVPQIYRCQYQTMDKDLAIFLRGHLDSGAIPQQVRGQVQSINPELPVFGAARLSDAVSGSLAQRRFSMNMILLFALTALFLAALGIYGTISLLVSERTHEIGIRLALGATEEISCA